MPKLLIAFASAMLLLASSGIWKANAATITKAGTLAPLTKCYTRVEEIGCYDDTVAVPIAVVIMAMATVTQVMAMPTQPQPTQPTQPTRITATATGHTVITVTAGATKEQWPPQ